MIAHNKIILIKRTELDVINDPELDHQEKKNSPKNRSSIFIISKKRKIMLSKCSKYFSKHMDI